MKKVRITALLTAIVMLLCAWVVPVYADDGDDVKEVFGYIEDDLYINDFFNFAYMLPDDTFSFASDEELVLLGRISSAIINSDEFDVSDMPDTWQEMSATSIVTGENVNITITVVPEEAQMVYELLPISSIAEMSIEALKSTMETSAMSFDYLEIDEEPEYAFDNYCCLRGKLSFLGFSVYEEMIFFYKDGFQVVITAGGDDEERPNELLGYFFMLEDDTNSLEFSDTEIGGLAEEDDGDMSESWNNILAQLNDLLNGMNGTGQN